MTGVIPRFLLAYVDRALGAEAVRQVLAAAGWSGDEVARGRWVGFDAVIALAEAAAQICGDADIGRRAGEELLRAQEQRPAGDVLRGLGSIERALAFAADEGTKMSTGRTLRLLDAGDDRVEIECRYQDLRFAHTFFCGQGAGYFGSLPSLFGARGTISEPECQLRGWPRCLYVVTWEPDPRAASVPDTEASSHRSNRTIERFEQLQAMAAELSRSEDVETLLDRVTERAGLAVDASRYLLAVRTRPGARVRVHHRGFSEEAADRFAVKLLGGEVREDGPSPAVVVDVASARSHFGRLAALFPPGSAIRDTERRLLGAYAGHAASALETVGLLEAARRERDTARGLWGLARALASVGTRSEMAQRLADAVPVVVRCDQVTVWLWEKEERQLKLTSYHDAEPELTVNNLQVVSADDLPGLERLVENPRPQLLEVEAAPPLLAEALSANGIAYSLLVPIASRGEFLGIVTAGFRGPRAVEADDEDLFERLGGLADQAAAALDNARLLEQIRHQAHHDALTGLPNRPLVEDRAGRLLDPSAPSAGAAVLFIDLDRFKNVNDTLGHRAGDELIRQVAKRLEGSMRAGRGDVLARLGGDEFVVLLSGSGGESGASRVAERLIEALRQPFRLSGIELFVSCSVGIAVAPEHGEDYATLMQHADTAMYEAKSRGRNTYAVYAAPAVDTRRERLDLESALHKALERDEFEVLYQPQVELTSMRVVAFEALVRWDHPTFGRLAPDAFLPLAEETGLVVGIDRWVRESAVAQARAWMDAGLPTMRVCINLSTRDLHRPELADEIRSLLATHGLPPGLLEVEVTDRVVMDEDDLPLILHKLREIGVRLAIDDFGTGNSVLSRLQRCPIQTLKIDRSFIQGIDSSDADAPLVEALVAMGRSLRLEVVAEGVETAEQAEAVRRFGCELAQGYYFAGPREAAKIEAPVLETAGAQPR